MAQSGMFHCVIGNGMALKLLLLRLNILIEISCIIAGPHFTEVVKSFIIPATFFKRKNGGLSACPRYQEEI